ncbi:class I SAM-dependent methyltransferase [Nannocystis bainbridge]|uniref:Methyltransferase n=1 Tax=Nannocystis bainbridge TaxID=2995303 RepID=A0ABT5DXQ0_9BACT|nr:methyltransferase [Nannocystis bainbridge]MDC0717943.1 methyltransferase [Nannocystis bainbridge]
MQRSRHAAGRDLHRRKLADRRRGAAWRRAHVFARPVGLLFDKGKLHRLQRALKPHLAHGWERAVFAAPQGEGGAERAERVLAGPGIGVAPSAAQVDALLAAAGEAAGAGLWKQTLVLDARRRVQVDARHGRATTRTLDEDTALKVMGGKERALRPDTSAALLREIGIMNADGSISATHARKYKQICHLATLCEPVIDRLATTRAIGPQTPLRALDLACGNAYLSFVLAEVLRLRGVPLRLHGVDVRADLVDRSRARAQALGLANGDPSPADGAAPPSPVEARPSPGDARPSPGDAGPSPDDARPSPDDARPSPGDAGPSSVEARPSPGDARPSPGDARPSPGDARPSPVDARLVGLSFARADIAGAARTAPAQLGGVPDLVLALHACDTATDEAIALAIQLGAPALLSVPCCQAELAAQLARAAASAQPLAAMVDHGLLRRAYADVLTDSLRVAALEACGYEVTVLEFVGGEHTPKNLLIKAHRRHPRAPVEPRRWRLEPLQARCEALGVQPDLLRRLSALQASSSPDA